VQKKRKSPSSVPTAPPNFNPKRFFGGTFWFQKWEMFEGVVTPGINDIARLCDDLGLPKDLKGARILDIGAWNGCLSFECERRGAKEVVALGPESPIRTGFDKLKKALGSTRTHHVRGSVYDLSPKRLGTFDVVLFCGVLYHLRYPLLGIDNIRRVCRGEVFIESFITDSRFIVDDRKKPEGVPLKRISPSLPALPLWQFFRKGELNGDHSNWFGPNENAVLEAFRSAGFDIEPRKHRNDRGAFHAKVRKGVPEFLSMRSCEGIHYDALVSHLFDEKMATGVKRQQLMRALIKDSKLAAEMLKEKLRATLRSRLA